jgi:regulation of enolase protein 1 (concanavalin A-like superfamily)
MTSFTLPNIPVELQWKYQPVDWKLDAEHRLSIVAGEKTDWFIDPAGTNTVDTAPVALFTPPDASFLLSAKVLVDFASDFDAGVLQLRARDDLWAKLCFEYSPQHQPMIVSVVTRGVSDDCNSAAIAGREVYLRIAHTPQTTAFHYSLDGGYWRLVRYFTLRKLDNLQIGFSAQSPTGHRCAAIFSAIDYRAGTLKDNRSGE